MQDPSPLNLSKSFGAEVSRIPLNRVTSESTWMSLKNWRLEAYWILCKVDGLQWSINCPEMKRGGRPVG
jgi:hypothetical protein